MAERERERERDRQTQREIEIQREREREKEGKERGVFFWVICGKIRWIIIEMKAAQVQVMKEQINSKSIDQNSTQEDIDG